MLQKILTVGWQIDGKHVQWRISSVATGEMFLGRGLIPRRPVGWCFSRYQHRTALLPLEILQ